MTDVTEILDVVASGNETAAEELLSIVYDELRRIAQAKLNREKPGQTLQATALVHEAYMRLTGEDEIQWNSKRHFFAAAAEAMRRILIERARKRTAKKHGGEFDRVELDTEMLGLSNDERVLELNDALDILEKTELRKSQVVKLRFFAGLTNRETAAALDISEATADRDWVFARAWLRHELSSS